MSSNNKDEFSTSIYYFLIANQATHKEIGNFLDNSDINNNINDFNDIVLKSRELLRTDNSSIKGKKNKLSLENHMIYYMITTSDFFYLAAVRKNSQYCKKENLIFELMEDIDHQGIKKLVDKNGELTNVGKQNLKFSIEKYQESNLSKLTKNSLIDIILNQSDDQSNKSSMLNSHLNDIKKDKKSSGKNRINNVGEMHELQNKSSKKKEQRMKFQKDSYNFEKHIKFKKYRNKIIIGIGIIFILIIIIYLIVK
jgi:hypothetical protein